MKKPFPAVNKQSTRARRGHICASGVLHELVEAKRKHATITNRKRNRRWQRTRHMCRHCMQQSLKPETYNIPHDVNVEFTRNTTPTTANNARDEEAREMEWHDATQRAFPSSSPVAASRHCAPFSTRTTTLAGWGAGVRGAGVHARGHHTRTHASLIV